VEAPGTAPGSERRIPMSVYRRIRLATALHIYDVGPQKGRYFVRAFSKSGKHRPRRRIQAATARIGRGFYDLGHNIRVEQESFPDHAGAGPNHAFQRPTPIEGPLLLVDHESLPSRRQAARWEDSGAGRFIPATLDLFGEGGPRNGADGRPCRSKWGDDSETSVSCPRKWASRLCRTCRGSAFPPTRECPKVEDLISNDARLV
jgi:hypothetical protein